mmetsp:Transcript_24699/g.41759  ORF Transcript_24699/g.41759 Transcript_24699/m.41759 type:complete len:114 (-) Transcript_24699:700-1041(-)
MQSAIHPAVVEDHESRILMLSVKLFSIRVTIRPSSRDERSLQLAGQYTSKSKGGFCFSSLLILSRQGMLSEDRDTPEQSSLEVETALHHHQALPYDQIRDSWRGSPGHRQPVK